MNDKPYLGRCKEKGCDYALFATPEQIHSAEDWKAVTAGSGPHRVGNYGVFARCTNRHKVFPMRQIKGTYSKDHNCDSRCLNAKGHNCTCSCGGLNHGRGYAVDAHVHTAQPTTVPALLDPEATFNPITRQYEKMITEPQKRFIRNLLDERVIPAKGDQSGSERRTKALEVLDTMTLAQASKTIEWLLTLEKN